MLAAHVVLAVVKINAKGAYLPLALGDPSGVKSYLALNVMNTMSAPGVILSLDLLKWIVLALLGLGYLLSLAAARRASATVAGLYSRRSYFVAAAVGLSLVAGLLYAATVIRWLFIR